MLSLQTISLLVFEIVVIEFAVGFVLVYFVTINAILNSLRAIERQQEQLYIQLRYRQHIWQRLMVALEKVHQSDAFDALNRELTHLYEPLKNNQTMDWATRVHLENDIGELLRDEWLIFCNTNYQIFKDHEPLARLKLKLEKGELRLSFAKYTYNQQIDAHIDQKHALLWRIVYATYPFLSDFTMQRWTLDEQTALDTSAL